MKLPPLPDFRIYDMLRYRRAYDSEGERRFIERYIRDLTAPDGTPMTPITDKHARVVAYAMAIEHAPGRLLTTAFCASLDSLHKSDDPKPVVGVLAGTRRYATLPLAKDCLGGDSVAGCFVLTEMIKAGCPGMYFFFRGTTAGGIGSSFLTYEARSWLNGITHAIQFDYAGSTAVVTHMTNGRTCSDSFARALADKLDLNHEPTTSEHFTDAAVLSAIVPECTSVSVGSFDPGTTYETLDFAYLMALAESCADVFRTPQKFPIERRAGAYTEPDDSRIVGNPLTDFLIATKPTELVSVLQQHTYQEIADAILEMRSYF